jgi:secondary thiamine-phosphate synthase enzyme
MHELAIETQQRNEMVNITARLERLLKEVGVPDGILVAHVLHTTAGLTINENADPDVVTDILRHLEQLVPEQGNFQHAEGNSDAHIKASLMGNSLTIPVSGGRLVLGTWQGVYFCEFDGPRRRKIAVQVIKA